MDAPTIRPVTDLAADWPAIEPLLLALHTHHVPLVGNPLLEDWAQRHRALLEGSLASGDGVALLAEVDGVAVGFANGAIRRDPDVVRETFGYIDNVVVAPEHRGTRIASTLTDTLAQWFRDRGVHELQLSVIAANTHAVEVWRALGFEPLAYRMIRREA